MINDMTVNMNELKDFLKKNLKGRNVTAISKELGVSRSLIHGWSAGRYPDFSKLRELELLFDHLGCDLKTFLFSAERREETISAIEFENEGTKFRVIITKKK